MKRSAKPAPEPAVDDEPSEFLDERLAEDDPPAAAATPTPEEPDDREVGAETERKRCQGILQACRLARIPNWERVAEKMIADKVSLSDARGQVLELLGKGDREDVPRQGPPGSAEVVGDDPLVHKRKAMVGALLHRAAPQARTLEGKPRFPLTDEGRSYAGMKIIDCARVFVHARGMRSTHMSSMELLTAALAGGGMFVHNPRTDSAMDLRTGYHTTSDFPMLLADVYGKMLRAAYEEQPQTWVPISRKVTLPDFKPSRQLQLGEAPELEEVLEHGEFTRGTIGEAKEQFQLATYGKIFAITRQALINDDLDAFSRLASEFGRAARRKESDLAWAQITSNPVMGDGVVLFHAASHHNLTTPGTAISVDSLGVGRAALRLQKGIDGDSLMNLSARFLIVPAAKETIADQFTSSTFVPAVAGSVNPFAGRMQVIAEPRLDANSGIAWYLATSPDQLDVLLHGVLEGQEGPAIETRVGFDIDGVETKCRLDTAFKMNDWRGIYKNVGA